MKKKILKNARSSEAVSRFHPDKICDQISDMILDECISLDKNSHVACEVFATKKKMVIGGEISTRMQGVLSDNLFLNSAKKFLKINGIDYDSKIDVQITQQSLEIKHGVNKGGAGDQGIIFGYAIDETKECLPLAYVVASKIMMRADQLQFENNLYKSGSDKKCQVSVVYDENEISVVKKIVYSNQHEKNYDKEIFEKEIKSKVINFVLNQMNINSNIELLINSAGSFVKGGFDSDTGLTGRKIISDTYGGYGRHGGGAFSGKDPTKVDRSAAYMLRFIAKNIVKNKIAKHCLIELSYAIGVKVPIGLSVRLNGVWRGKRNEKVINYLLKHFDFSPQGIIKYLKLTEIKYEKISAYGHFLNPDCPWEQFISFKELSKILEKIK